MSDIRIKMAKELRDMSDMVGDLHWMAAKAVEDLTKKEGEIAKRDEELAACRVAVENCEVFRARIAELEARIVWLECEAQVNAAPVSEAKAQGVVQWPDADEIMQMAFEEGQPADDASGYCFELEEFDLFIERLMSEVARLNATHVQQPKCKTCDDNGMIGGPSFYAPDEGGEPCPDCSAPIQQVSVPVACSCGREYPANSYSAGFISGSGMCEVCDAAMPPKDIPQRVSVPDDAWKSVRHALEAAHSAIVYRGKSTTFEYAITQLTIALRLTTPKDACDE